MRRFTFLSLILFCGIFIVYAVKAEVPTEELKLYVVDAEMLHLIPVEISIKQSSADKQARSVIAALIRGHDDNPKIRRLIPDIRNCMSVSLRDSTAYVNITDKMIRNHPEGRDLERLTVYSIVNSLTSIDGIDNVRFTINGSVRKNFMGYMDMRQNFVYKSIV